MSLTVVYLPEARDDIVDAYVHYEQQRPGLGARFASALHDLTTSSRRFGLISAF